MPHAQDHQDNIGPLRSRLDEPAWRLFEIEVAALLGSYDSVAQVEHDVTVSGASGVERQVDVMVTGEVGPARIRIAVECKRHKRPCDISVVDAFIGVCLDLGVDRGMLYSVSGFTSGAQARAKSARNPGIGIQELTPIAAQFDYAELLGMPCPGQYCSAMVELRWSESETLSDGGFGFGECHSCGSAVIYCGGCGETQCVDGGPNTCWSCMAVYEVELDRKGTEVESVRQTLTSEGGPIDLVLEL
jgi:hypothetical protein